jgi:spore maturation protein CgeB
LLWPLVKRKARGALSDGEFETFVKSCRMVLGLNQGKDRHGRFASYLKFRDVEFPGYGCCYLTEHNDDVADVFEVGNEVLTYRNMWEAADQIRRVRRAPEQARQIGVAGRQRVLAEHVWAVRLEQLAGHL